MVTFRYQALLPSGKKTSGYINADHLADAKDRLLKREFLLTQVKPLSDRKNLCRLSKNDLLLFTREVSKLLGAGLPLYEVLLALEEKYRDHKCHPILLDIGDKVKQGMSFSYALKQHPESFDSLYLCMMENAERTGSLQKALDEMASFITRQLSVKKQLLTALLYPCLLSVFCLAVLSTLFFYVIPSLSELFQGRRLHPLTAAILAISQTMSDMKTALAVGLAALLTFFAYGIFSQKGKKFLSSLAMHLPLIKGLLLKVALIRFCRSSGAMLQSGVPFLESLSLARRVMQHGELEKIMEQAEQGVLEGAKISDKLKESSLIPSLVTRMLSIAEEGGNIPLMLQHIAQIYEEELEKNLARLTQVAQPVLLLFIGAVVGFVLLSVLLPLTDVSSFLEN